MTDKPDMEAVLLHYGADTVPNGNGWRPMRCPFHDDRNASASTNGEAFTCHACGVHGDSLAVIMNREQCSFKDALQVAESLGFQVADDRPTFRSGRRGPRTVKRYQPPGRRGRR